MGRLEEVLTTPLDRDAKNRLWQWSRAEYFEVHNPQLARLLGAEELKLYQVHHIYPMQYAHLFPKLDINGKANLVGIHKNVHDSISAVWLSLGRTAAARMKPQDVTRVTEIVNRHYKRWFHRIYNPKDADALASAERAALDEVAAIRAALMH